MKTVGIIAEYNPFHNGHRYQIEEIRRRLDDPIIVAAMSGSFTQRGEPAVLDKFIRAQTAVGGGVDLVVELPFVYAVRSAQDFARGGVNILSSIGIDYLAFGSELDDIDAIKNAADLTDSDDLKLMLKEKLSEGQSYARAMREALSSSVVFQPNAMLAVEYMRALRSTAIKPLLIKRIGAAHDAQTIEGMISSASAIRAAIPDWTSISKAVDARTLEALRSNEPPSIEKLFLPLIIKIINGSTEELRSIYGMVEGLEYKLIGAARTVGNLDELIGSIVCRRYTRGRLQRLLLHLILELTVELVKKFDGVSYIRPLAFNERGRQLLRSIKNSGVPIVIKTARHLTTRALYNRLPTLENYQQMLAFDVRATDLRELLCPTPRAGLDFYRSISLTVLNNAVIECSNVSPPCK